MNIVIKTPCMCVLDNEGSVFTLNQTYHPITSMSNEMLQNTPSIDNQYTKKKSNKKKYKGFKLTVINNKHIISDCSDGSETELDEELMLDLDLIHSVTIKSKNVEVILDRIVCSDRIYLSVCKESCIWLKNFDDVFPLIDIKCTGRVSSLDSNPFIVRELHISMDPDYCGQSSVDGFQVVDLLHIHYQYNGQIIGRKEQNCQIRMPVDDCLGKSVINRLTKISTPMQKRFDESRCSDGYHILTKRLQSLAVEDTDSQSEENVYICRKCESYYIDVMLSPCQHKFCYVCIYELAEKYQSHLLAPYFNCPTCYKDVKNMHKIRRLGNSGIL